MPSTPETTDALKTAGLIQEQAPLPGRYEEIDQLAKRFGRDPGVVVWPARELERLMKDDDWDFGPNIRACVEHFCSVGAFPTTPTRCVTRFGALWTNTA